MKRRIASCTIATLAFESLLAQARAAAPAEACGLLLGRDGAIERAEPCANVAAAPQRAFEIDPAALLRLHRAARAAGIDVLGHYHSHPDGSLQPSRTDAARAVADGQLWLIVGDDAVAAWQAVPDGPVHGVFAPVDLVVG